PTYFFSITCCANLTLKCTPFHDRDLFEFVLDRHFTLHGETHPFTFASEFLVVYVTLFLFFFFQAEDGIRDRNVTGVQTCALPILLCSSKLLVLGFSIEA